jgi:hypothetical protein
MRELFPVWEMASCGAGTAGWIRTTDLLIHSKFSASDVRRPDLTRFVADPAISLAIRPFA